jgi:uncharacterized protein (DUF2235 family)
MSNKSPNVLAPEDGKGAIMTATDEQAPSAPEESGEAAKGKNIVLCSDGTGNRGGKTRGTNVWAIFNAVWRGLDCRGQLAPRSQVAFYDDGVGTQSMLLLKILGGAFGWGYSRNIRQLYKALVTAYDRGDAIYVFGFSRGAYTVRGLVDMVMSCGILNRHQFYSSAELDDAVWTVFRAYRDQYRSSLPGSCGGGCWQPAVCSATWCGAPWPTPTSS